MNWNRLARWSAVALVTLGLGSSSALAQTSAAATAATTAPAGKHRPGLGRKGDCSKVKANVEKAKSHLADVKARIDKMTDAAKKEEAQKALDKATALLGDAQKALDANDCPAARKAMRQARETWHKYGRARGIPRGR